MICKSCGAMIHYGENDRYAVCEYCDTEVKIQRDGTGDAARVRKPIKRVTNALICSVPSCGATVFQRKTFNVYTHFAELVDTKTGKLEHHIDYSLVRTRGAFLGTNIVFTMMNGEKITVKLMFGSNFDRVQEAFRGLV